MRKLGFEAVATTSWGLATQLGLRDGTGAVGREETLANGRLIAGATDLPVNADLENGFGDAPGHAAETVRQAAALGLAGGSIEDATGRSDQPIYLFEQAVERVRAAADAARESGFVLTARAENWLHGVRDADDTLRRLRAYADAGAQVLFAPFAPLELQAEAARIGPPLSVLAPGPEVTVGQLAELGAARISVGGWLARAATTAVRKAAEKMRDGGGFGWTAALDGFPG